MSLRQCLERRIRERLGAAPVLAVLCLWVTVQSVQAAPPPGYYDTVNATNSTTLRPTLHAVIKDHTRYPYTASSTDTWNILERADEDPNNASNILDVYLNASYTKVGGGGGPYNREHAWPKSYGFPNDNSTNYPYTDCHHLFLCNSGYNSSRSNKPYRYCNAGCTERTTNINNSQGGGSGTYPGNSNWTSGSFTTGTWETWIGRRGDVARALFYLDVRYEGGTHGITGAVEPDLILTDSEALIAASNTGSNESVAYMGMLSVLLQWNHEDPVDAAEQARNDAVFSFQGNRNPFIDNPGWADCLFNNVCAGLCSVAADCDDGLFCNGAEDCVGGSCVAGIAPCGGQSCNEATNTCSGGGSGGSGGGSPWINEFHYDNASSDTGEIVEIAGPAGTDLTGWSVVGYNGNGGGTYKTVSLSGTISDQQGCMGTLWFAFSGMQNGAPDGLALVDGAGTVIEFISYEGSFTATSGPASGMTSTDIGVSESGSTPAGNSLQLGGTGSQSSDFTWQVASPNTQGQLNSGQTFSGCSGGSGGCSVDADCDDAVFCNGTEACVNSVCQAGTPVNCDDGVACTDDSCNEATASCDNVTNNTNCDDGVFCNGAEVCDSVLGCQAGVDPCPGQFCDEGAGICTDCQINADCDDGVFCNGDESCVGGFCLAGTPINCDDGVACTDDSCNEATASCDNFVNDANCDDGLFCNGAEVCDAVFDCQVGNDPCPGQSCDEATNVCFTPSSSSPWINEFHYDNSGSDTGEFVEIAGPAGTNLTGWSVVGYNGNGGATYKTVNLSGAISDQQGCMGTLWFAFRGMQNGAPDGLALVDTTGAVIEFISYEGSFTAVDGPANGMISTNIGVSESSSTPTGNSLQLGGTGSQASDFTWQTDSANTKGQPNTGQTFSGCGI